MKPDPIWYIVLCLPQRQNLSLKSTESYILSKQRNSVVETLCYRIVKPSSRSYLFSKCLSLKFKVCCTLKFSQRQHYDKNDTHIYFVFSHKIYFNTFWHGGIFLFSFGLDYFSTEFLTQLFYFSIGEKWQKLGYFDNCSARWV